MPQYRIKDRLDLFQLQRATKQFASQLGFDRRACEELAIVASELSSNVLKYGKSGTLELSEMMDAAGKAMVIAARDAGPPFRNLETALKDGHDDNGPIDPATLASRGGLGTGLGAVVRLSHDFRVEPEPTGKRVVAIRYLHRKLA
jgi:anti-sigma regulatory factor (Ser/Thr protein kinase)